MILINQYKKKDAADRNDLLYKNPCTSHAPVQIFGVFILIFMYFLKSSYLHERITKHVHIDVFYHNQKEKCKGFTLNPSFLKKRKRLTPFPPIFLKKRKPPPPKRQKKPKNKQENIFIQMTIPHATWHCFVSYLLLTVLCRVFDCMDEVVFHTPILSPLRVHHLSTTEQQQHKRNTASPRATGSPTKRTFYHIKSSAGLVEGQCIEKPVKKAFYIYILLICMSCTV